MTEGTFKMYTIKQVAEEFGVSDNTIRNWEKEFGDMLNIQRDSNGSRYYLPEDIENLRTIERLRSEGFAIAQIKKIFETVKIEKGGDSQVSGVSKDEFYALKQMLISSQPEQKKEVVSKEDFDTFQKNMVEAISAQFQLQFQQLSTVMNDLQYKINNLDSRMTHLLEAPKDGDSEQIHKEFEDIKELYTNLQESFQASEHAKYETNELIKQQSAAIENMSRELKEREQKFANLVNKFREDRPEEEGKEEKKGFWAKLFSK